MDIEAAIVCASERLGYTSIRPNQHKAARSFMDHKDVFINLSTGSGKSFFVSQCYPWRLTIYTNAMVVS